MRKTNEGANMFDSAIDTTIEFFSKAGSLFVKKESFYGGEKSALELFKPAFNDDAVTSLKLFMWLRDCRGGAGNRSGARSIITWLGNTYPEVMKANMHYIPIHGRWDDLCALFTTPLRDEAGMFWASAIKGGDVLAAKWAKRHYKPIRLALGLKEGEFRKLLSSIRKDHIVEHVMCQRNWSTIDYNKVPSVAMARYTRAFARHDDIRFQSYKNALVSGVDGVKINAEALFPHDCIRTALNADGVIAEAQFNALPNYMENDDENIMVICDTSGSMRDIIGGSVQAIHVSQGMALYCSSRVPVDSPFYKRFIAFGSEGKFVDWRKHTFQSALRDRNVFDGAIASTRIDKALNLILKTAINRSIHHKFIPTTLLIVSDMQFSEGATGGGGGWNTHGLSEKQSLTEVENMMLRFEDAGYDRPKIVYWNTAGYEGSQNTVNSNNIGLVSGFSPSICSAIFGGNDFTPYAIMMRALEKYEVMIPTTEGKFIKV